MSEVTDTQLERLCSAWHESGDEAPAAWATCYKAGYRHAEAALHDQLASREQAAELMALRVGDLEQQLAERDARAMSFHKVDRGYGWKVLMGIHNTEMSVGKACELIRAYLATGVEVPWGYEADVAAALAQGEPKGA